MIQAFATVYCRQRAACVYGGTLSPRLQYHTQSFRRNKNGYPHCLELCQQTPGISDCSYLMQRIAQLCKELSQCMNFVFRDCDVQTQTSFSALRPSPKLLLSAPSSLTIGLFCQAFVTELGQGELGRCWAGWLLHRSVDSSRRLIARRGRVNPPWRLAVHTAHSLELHVKNIRTLPGSRPCAICCFQPCRAKKFAGTLCSPSERSLAVQSAVNEQKLCRAHGDRYVAHDREARGRAELGSTKVKGGYSTPKVS